MKAGFTLVELLLIMGILAILTSLGSINYFSTFNQTKTGVAKDVLISDLRSAQNKAMSGEAVGGVTQPSWGVKLLVDSYVIFPGDTYIEGAPDNYLVALPADTALTTTFPAGVVLFRHGSGEVVGYDAVSDTITLVTGSSSESLELNVFGVVTSL